ncbi:type IV pilus assembly protein PilM [Candidatus Dojkabacteria bacterium]|nr:type IV pilus assembly protein PilM [Candidatus Dojkabacteria bacterium]
MAERLPDHFGIDFGNHSVKAVYLKNFASKTPELAGIGNIKTPFGVLNSENDVHKDRLASVVRQMINDAGIRVKQVVAAVPESVVSTRVSTYKGVKESELAQAVYWDAKQSLPVPIEEMQVDHTVLGEKKETQEFLVLRVAATKKIIQTYIDVLERAGLEPIAIETEGVAIARMIKHTTGIPEAIVLDFGSQTTDMSIVKQGNLVFSQSISTGSDSLTRSIMNDFSLEYPQAEEYKIKYGLEASQLEGKIFNSLEPIVKIIVGEVVRGIEFYKSQTGFSSPKDVYLVGDGALLPGLALYLTDQLGLNISLADPWQNFKIRGEYEKILENSRSAYAVAVGLALKDI